MPEIRIMIPENMERALNSLIRAGIAGNKAEIVRGAITQYLSTVPTILSKDYDLESVFSPDGRILQVEYAMIASDKGFPSIGIQCNEGLVLMKQLPPLRTPEFSFLRKNASNRSIKQITDRIRIALAGISTDGNLVIHQAKKLIMEKNYNSSFDLYSLVEELSFYLHSFTINKDLRVLGAKFIIGGFDKDKNSKLFLLGPSGTIHETPLVAIGLNATKIIDSLIKNYNSKMNLKEIIHLGLKTLVNDEEGAKNILIDVLDNKKGIYYELSLEEKIEILKYQVV